MNPNIVYSYKLAKYIYARTQLQYGDVWRGYNISYSLLSTVLRAIHASLIFAAHLPLLHLSF